MKKNWWMLGFFLLAACSSDGGDDAGSSVSIATTPLSGKVDGKAWTFVSGATDAFLSEGESTLFTTLYAEAIATCDGIPSPTQPEVLIQLPRQPGTYPLSLARNATFAIQRSPETDNLVATKGKLVIDEVTATTVKGGAYIEYDANNSVNGTFEATICTQ